MNRKTTVWLSVAAVLVALGLLTFAVVMTVYGWDLAKLSTVDYETNTYVFEEVRDISIETETADVLFLPSEDGACKVVCYEPTEAKHTVEVKDGKLTVKVRDDREWYDYIGIMSDSPAITVYLPAKTLGTVAVKGTTGDVKISHSFSFEGLGITLSTGDVVLRNITCEGEISVVLSTGDLEVADVFSRLFVTKASAGDVELENLLAEEKLSVRRSTGDIEFDGVDASEITIETSTGDIEGTLCSGKHFIADSDTGDVRVPKDSEGGTCRLNTSTGDIRVRVAE